MAEVQSFTLDLENKGLLISRPGDAIPTGFLTSMLNLTANKTGFLQSRGGTSRVSSTNLGSSVHSQGRILIEGTPYIYQGAGTSLYRAFSSIATGFSGNLLTMREGGPDLAIKPQEIIFDSNVRYKDNGTTTTGFGIAGPMAAASAVAAAATTKTIDLFEYATNGAIQAAWPTSGATITTTATTPAQGTYSGNLAVNASTTGYATLTSAFNLNQFSAAGDSDDSDWIVIYLRIDQPTYLTEIRLMFDVDATTNDFDHNYYLKAIAPNVIAATIDGTSTLETGTTDLVSNIPLRLDGVDNVDSRFGTVPPVELATGTNQWLQIFVRKSEFTRVGTSSNNWANVAAIRIQVQTNADGAVNLGIDDLIMQGSTTGRLDADDYSWIYRYENENTGSVSPFSEDMVAANNTNGVTVQKTKATVTVRNPRDTQATHIQLYRRGGDNSIYSFVDRYVVSSWTGTVALTDGTPDQSLGDTADLTQVELANLLQTPSQTSTSVRKTVNSGGAYTNYTADVSDDNSGTYADLSALDTVGNGDWLVIGADSQFRQILIVMDSSVNANAAVLTVQYWNGSAWRAVLNQSDGTSAAGKTLAQGGTVKFDFPIGWETVAVDSVTAFYVRFTVSAALSAAVHVTEVRVGANAFDPTTVEIHNGRVWTDDSAHTDRIWYSERFGIEEFLADNFIVASVGGDPVVRPEGLDDQLFAFTQKTVNRIVGSTSDSFAAVATGSEEGLFGKQGICRGRGKLFYRAYSGIYGLPASGYAEKLSLAIDGLFHGFPSEDGDMQPIDQTLAATETMEFFDAKLWYNYTDTNGDRQEITYDLDTERWEPTDRTSTSYLRLDDVGEFYSGDESGYVYQRLTGNQDQGIDIPLRFRTQYLDFGGASATKQLTEIVIDANLAGETLTFYADLNNGLGVSQSAAVTNSSRGLVYLPLSDDTQARNVACRLESNNGGSLVKFYKITFFYIVLPTLLTKHATDWEDLGYVGDKRLRQLQIEIDTQGVDVSIAVQVDDQTTETLTVNTTAKTIVPYSLMADTIGKLTRLILTGTSGFRYYTHQFEFLKDPLQMTRYDTVELDFGYTRWKFLRRVWVAANTPSTVTMAVYVDQMLRFTTTFTLSSASGWIKQEIKLPPGLEGMLFRFVFTSDNRFKVFLDQSDVEWHPLADQRGYQRGPMARQT